MRRRRRPDANASRLSRLRRRPPQADGDGGGGSIRPAQAPAALVAQRSVGRPSSPVGASGRPEPASVCARGALPRVRSFRKFIDQPRGDRQGGRRVRPASPPCYS
uniref:Uncharacterized protein n=1 Tax=Plectus sambesii TaxID=2011161 RepID=A0A914V1M2_9BILA